MRRGSKDRAADWHFILMSYGNAEYRQYGFKMRKPYRHIHKKIYADDLDRRDDLLELAVYCLGILALAIFLTAMFMLSKWIGLMVLISGITAR